MVTFLCACVPVCLCLCTCACACVCVESHRSEGVVHELLVVRSCVPRTENRVLGQYSCSLLHLLMVDQLRYPFPHRPPPPPLSAGMDEKLSMNPSVSGKHIVAEFIVSLWVCTTVSGSVVVVLYH